jgi:lysophospholipase L1-like esterase
MGLVRNYADPNPVSKVPLPALLNRTIAADQNSPIWNENNYNPDGVIINLGTNDFSTQPNPDKDVFINAYVALITRIQKAHPHAAVFAVCGPMIGNPCCQYVEQAVIEADEQGLNAHFVNLQGLLTTPADYGCAGHPSVSGHTKMFEKLYPIVEMVLHW